MKNLAVLFVLLCLCACGSGSSTSVGNGSYNISGTVTSNGAALAGVTVTLSGSATGTATTDTNGNYSFTGANNGSYNINVAKNGYTFNPASFPVSVSNAHAVCTSVTATALTYNISGTVTASGAALAGVNITLSGDATGTTTTDAGGNYSFVAQQYGSYTITPSISGYAFTPDNLSVTVSNANIIGKNFTADPDLNFTLSGTVTANGSALAGVNVTLSGTSTAITTTDANGNYSIIGQRNGSYTITPAKAGYVFTPASLSVAVNNADVPGKNFTTTALAYSISGTVTANNMALAGVTVRLSGAIMGITTTDTNGNYSFTGQRNGSYSITPAKTGYTFTPTSLSVTVNNASVTGNNFTSATSSSRRWSSPTLIEADDVGDAICPQIAIDGFGNAIAVWHQWDAYRPSIWTNRYTAATGSWGTAELIETGQEPTGDPQVAIDASGNALAIWYQDNSIWSNRYTASTGTWATQTVAAVNTPRGYNPKMAMNASGNAVAVWNQYDGNYYKNWSSRYRAATGTWSTAELIETAGYAYEAQVAIDASGNAIAIWAQNDGARYNIYSNRYTASTGSWSTAELIETDNGGDAFSPQITFDASGNAVAVWAQHQSTYSICNIWSNSYTAATHSWGTAVRLETDNLNAFQPQVALDVSGNAVAIWALRDGDSFNIFSNLYTASTGAWGTATMIAIDNIVYNGITSAPQVKFDASGHALAVWYQSDGTRYSIWSNVYR